MKILITGSRDWRDPLPINVILAGCDVLAEGQGKPLILIHGGNPRGADRMAEVLGPQWNAEVITVPAKWDEHGVAAGPIRNKAMLVEHSPDVVFAFRSSTADRSPGTDDMIRQARRAGIPTYVVQRD